MNEHSIRARIRSKLATGLLKTHDGMIVAAASRNGEPCSACGLPIDATDAEAMPYGHAYPGRTHWFHVGCHALWDAEREPGAPLRENGARYTRSARRYSAVDA